MRTINEPDEVPPNGRDITFAFRTKASNQETAPRPAYGPALEAYGVNNDSSLAPFTTNKDLLTGIKKDNFYSPRNDHFYSRMPYLDLDEDYGEIRLLKVSASTGDPRLCYFELVDKVPIASVQGRYTALSYCAGSPEKTNAVLVNGLPFNAFANLEHALQASLKFWKQEMGQKEMLIWADQICINQSNPAERASQVLMMPEIYRRSEQALVCLSSSSNAGSKPAGALGEYSNGPLQTRYDYTALEQLEYDDGNNDNDEGENVITPSSWTKEPLNSFQNPFTWMRHCCERASIAIAQSRLSVLNPKQLSQGHNSLNTFLLQEKSKPAVLSWVSYIRLVCSCPWWERAWVLQEFINAPKAVFLYKNESIPWPTLYIFISYFAERMDTFFASWEDEINTSKKRAVQRIANLKKKKQEEREASERIQKEMRKAREKREGEVMLAKLRHEAKIEAERSRAWKEYQMQEEQKHKELMSILSRDYREKLQKHQARMAKGGLKSMFTAQPETPQEIMDQYHDELRQWSYPKGHSRRPSRKPKYVAMMEKKYPKLVPSNRRYLPNTQQHSMYSVRSQGVRTSYSNDHDSRREQNDPSRLDAYIKEAEEASRQIKGQIAELGTIRNKSLDFLTSKAWFMITMKANWCGRTDLMTLLCYARSSKASDPRDRIYAFLGLSHKGYKIIPSYTPKNTIFHTFVGVAKAIVEHHDDLKILSHVNTGRDLLGCYLPSWAPDWNAVPSQEAVEFQKLFSTWQKKRGREFQASKGEKSRASFKAHKTIATRCELRVKGIEVDALVCVTNEHDSSWLQFESFNGYTIATPAAALPDDQVWVLFGANRPVILREGFNNKYNFIGEALVWEGKKVSQIMFGSSMDDNLESARDIGIL